jgi:hypothetical protein
MGVQIEEVSKLGLLIGWSKRDIWEDSLYFLHAIFGSICKTFAYFQLSRFYLKTETESSLRNIVYFK